MIAQVAQAQSEKAGSTETIGNFSPDKRFAMRISYDAEMIAGVELANGEIFSDAIKAIELVALPAKRVVARLLPKNDVGTHYEDITLVWSSDSKWCAFYYRSPRVGYTAAHTRSGDKFVALNKPTDLRVKIKGDGREEFIRPLRWAKPGELVLDQMATFRPDAESRIQFIAPFDGKGKFRVLNKKDVTLEEQ